MKFNIELQSLLESLFREMIEQEKLDSVLKTNKGEWVLIGPNDPRRTKIRDELFQLTQKTYESMGGHVKIKSPEDLENYKIWAVIDLDSDPEPDAVIMAKPNLGSKKTLGATDGSGKASSEYKAKMSDLLSGGSLENISNWWGEFSDKLAYALLSRNAPAIEDENVARKILKQDFEWHGEHPDPAAPDVFRKAKGWYTRSIGGKKLTKILLGNPKSS